MKLMSSYGKLEMSFSAINKKMGQEIYFSLFFSFFLVGGRGGEGVLQSS